MRPVLLALFMMMASPSLSQSLSQNDIIQVQGLLSDMGYRAEVGSVDGIMGSGTSNAIATFQRETGRNVTGEPSLELIAILRQLHAQGWDRGDAVSSGPSFDCGRATTSTERTICADPRLSRLDRDLSEAYAAALSRSSRDHEIRASQRRWIELRNSCGNDIDCINNAMTGQISILSDF